MMADAAPRVVVVGEALVDIVHRASGAVDEAPGGSPANVALTLGRLGRAPTLVNRLADDDRGRRVRRWLGESHVSVVAVEAARTSTATAHLDDAGAARYEFDLRWDLGGLDRGVTEAVELLHVGSVAAVLEPGAGQVRALVETVRPRATITYDPNIRPALIDDAAAVRERVAVLVGLSDIVKASDEDLRWLHPGRDLIEVAREWQSRGPSLVVVTLGSGGALAVTSDGILRVPAVIAAVVDTVGAGDTFMGTLIDGVIAHGAAGAALRGQSSGIPLDALERVLHRCAEAAAITVSRPGADPPRRAELFAAVG